MFVHKASKVPLKRLSPEWAIALTLSTFSLVVLVFLVIVRMVDAFRGGWNYLKGRYDIAAVTQRAPQNDNGWHPFDWLKGHVGPILRKVDAFRRRWHPFNWLKGHVGPILRKVDAIRRRWHPFDWLKGGHVLFGRSLCWTQFP